MTLGYTILPQVVGPDLIRPNVCLFLLESGNGFIETENAQGSLQLETCRQIPPPSFSIELEDGSGQVLLETSDAFIELELGP